jgi:CBS domain-containing protein
MRTEIISVLKQHFEAHILKHKMNVDIMLSNPTAIHDHTDLMDAIEKEVAQIAEYQDKLEVMETYFKE